jgi:hypothetical protein
VGLDTVEILWAVEDAFGIEISDAEAAGCRTVGDLNECIARLVAERATAVAGLPITSEPDLTWPLLVAIVGRTSGVRAGKVRPESNWREDLGLN